MAETRVVLADDHPLFRHGLRALLDAENDLRVVAEAADGTAALAAIADHDPDVVILDLEMGEVGGLQVARTLVAEGRPTRILLLSAYHDDFFIAEALALGVGAFFTKDEAGPRLVTAVRALAGGGAGWMSPRVASRATAMRCRATAGRRLLSRREVDVLRLVADGMINKEIAKTLHLARSTVKNHLGSIFSKLGAGSRTEAVLAAHRMGYLTLTPKPPSRR